MAISPKNSFHEIVGLRAFNLVQNVASIVPCEITISVQLTAALLNRSEACPNMLDLISQEPMAARAPLALSPASCAS